MYGNILRHLLNNRFVRSGATTSLKARNLREPSVGTEHFHVREDLDSLVYPAALDGKIVDYHTAMLGGDDFGVRSALQDIVNIGRSVHNAAGLPVYAHAPLPPQFARSLVHQLSELPKDARLSEFDRLVEQFELSVRPHAAQQIASQLARTLAKVRSNRLVSEGSDMASVRSSSAGDFEGLASRREAPTTPWHSEACDAARTVCLTNALKTHGRNPYGATDCFDRCNDCQSTSRQVQEGRPPKYPFRFLGAGKVFMERGKKDIFVAMDLPLIDPDLL